MSDVPVLQYGDVIHVLIGVSMSPSEISDIKDMYEIQGIKVAGITRISGGTFQIASIIKGKPPIAGPSMPRTR